jgi:TonB-linked SusC/RagA family outer membrane protein
MRMLLCVGLVVAASVLGATGTVAQERGTIQGRVTAEGSQAPLAGATVTVSGTSFRAVTNQEGEYRLPNVSPGVQEVTASLLGYAAQSQRVTVAPGGTPTTADFQLEASALEIGGIVVTATGREQRVREVGNAVTAVDMSEVNVAATPQLANVLQGRTPGVTVAPTSGTVGTGQRIQIRGVNSLALSSTPLLIVDGIRVSNETESTGLFTGGISTSRWNDINPEDIESVEVLKGPAASALYGTAAANGVIQITTKKGRAGRTTVRTWAQRTAMEIDSEDVPTNYLARGFRSDLGEIGTCGFVERAAGTCAQVDSLYAYNPLLNNPNSPLRTGLLDRLGLSIAGGSDEGEVTYYVSAETERGPGTIRGNDLDRQNFRANLTAGPTSELRLTASTSFTNSFIELPQEGNTGSGAWLNALLDASPDPVSVEECGGFTCPYTAETVGMWKNEEDLRRFTGSLAADWRPNSWLHLNSVVGLDQSNRFERSLVNLPGLPTGSFSTGLREQYRTQDQEFTANLNANATRDLSSAIVSTTSAGVQYNQTESDWTYACGESLSPGTISPAVPCEVDEFYGETKLFGVYANQQFGINDRLFVAGAVRGDQNSAFGENIGFVVYPAFSASWVVAEEPWFPQPAFLSNLRLRAAYGESGQRPGRLSAVRTYDAVAVALGNETTSGFIIENLGNPDLSAEISREWEFGGDLGLLDDRVGIEVTRYDKTTTDALVLRPLAPSVGGPEFQYFNLGEVHNQGWEGAVRVEPIRTERIGVNLGMRFHRTENELVSFGEEIPDIVVGLQRHVEGYPLGGYWAPDWTFQDANADGLIQTTEVTRTECELQDNPDACTSFQGSPFPTRELSFTGDVTLLGMFRVSSVFDHKGGHKLFNWGNRIRTVQGLPNNSEWAFVPGAASLEQQAGIQAFRLGFGSAGFIEDADFWKWRELAVSFTTPQRWLDRVGIANAVTLTLAGRNLATWSDYTGPDPEVNIPGSVDAEDDPGSFYTVDLLSQPPARTFMFRVDVGF